MKCEDWPDVWDAARGPGHLSAGGVQRRGAVRLSAAVQGQARAVGGRVLGELGAAPLCRRQVSLGLHRQIAAARASLHGCLARRGPYRQTTARAHRPGPENDRPRPPAAGAPGALVLVGWPGQVAAAAGGVVRGALGGPGRVGGR